MSWNDDIALKEGNSFGINKKNENVGDKFSLLHAQVNNGSLHPAGEHPFKNELNRIVGL